MNHKKRRAPDARARCLLCAPPHAVRVKRRRRLWREITRAEVSEDYRRLRR